MPIRKENPPRKRLTSSNNSIIVTEYASYIDLLTVQSTGMAQYMASNEAELLLAFADARASGLSANIYFDGPVTATADRDFIIPAGEPEISFVGYPRNTFDVAGFRINVSRITIDGLDLRTSGEKYLWVKEGYVTLRNVRFFDDVTYNATVSLMKTHLACYDNAVNNTGKIVLDEVEHFAQNQVTNQSGDIQPIVISNSGSSYTQLYVIIRNINAVLSYERFSRVLLKASVSTPFKVTGDTSWRFHPAQDLPGVNNIAATSDIFFRTPVTNSRIYRAFLTQTGTNAPTASILYDSVLPALTRTAAGTYSITKTGYFTAGKSAPKKKTAMYDDSGNKITVEWIDADHYQVKTYAAADLLTPVDGILSDTEIFLETYL